MKLRTILLTLIAATAISSCSNAAKSAPDDTSEAMEQGQADAKAILTIDRSPQSLHNALLSVKAREWQMRSNGDDNAANCYINAFRDYLSLHDRSLHDEIF